MLLSEYLSILSSLELTTKTLEKISILKPHSKDPYFLSLLTMPTLNIGEQTIIKALSINTGHSIVDIKAELILEGNLSTVVEKCLTDKKLKPLNAFFKQEPIRDRTIEEIYYELIKLSTISKQSEQFNIVHDLLSITSSPHLINIITGDRSIGILHKNIFRSISDDYKNISKAYAICNNWFTLLDNINDLSKITPQLYNPISPELCLSATVEDLKNIEQVIVDTKSDGVRMQGHVGKNIEFFTRNLENKTHSLPDMMQYIKEFKELNNIDNAIFDFELVASDGDKVLNRKEVIKRLGKHNISEKVKEVSLIGKIFDILYFNGQSLIEKPYTERRKILDSFNDTLFFSKTKIYLTDSLEELDEIFNEVIKHDEGIVIKPIDSLYVPGSRSDWKKIKPLIPSFDLIITKAYYGKGQNAKLYSSFEVSAQNDGMLIPICSVSSGFTQDELRKLTFIINSSKINKTSSFVEIIEPKIIIEVVCEVVNLIDGKLSCVHPRKVSIRDDKKEITDVNEIRKFIK